MWHAFSMQDVVSDVNDVIPAVFDLRGFADFGGDAPLGYFDGKFPIVLHDFHVS